MAVIRDAAIGAITLQRILYLMPSLASDSVKPTCASLAAVRSSAQCLASLHLHPPPTRVIALPKAPKQPRRARRVDHTSILLLPEMWPRSFRALVCSDDMHLHDQIPVLVLHVLETDIPQDTGVVDEHVYPAESLDGRLDDLVAILDRVVVGDCLAAGGGDLVDDGVGSLEWWY